MFSLRFCEAIIMIETCFLGYNKKKAKMPGGELLSHRPTFLVESINYENSLNKS